MSEGKIGTVKWYSDQNGWGIIGQDEGGDIFVYYSGIVEPGFRGVTEGERVRYTIEPDAKGPAAANVRRL
jgi:CspA family cold shock protein